MFSDRLLLRLLLSIVFLLVSFWRSVEANDEQQGAPHTASQTFRFASYFESNMVLQRHPLRAVIWGYASVLDIGSMVYLNFSNAFLLQQYKTYVKKGPQKNIGFWQITLTPVRDVRPFTIIAALTSYNNIQIENVLFGDVWFCSGQSNMKLQISQIFNSTAEAKDSEKFDQIRFFSVGQVQSDIPLYDVSNIEIHWSVPNQNNILPFSAVCWLFAKYIYSQRPVPLGLVESSWGGTQIEAWSSPESLKSCGLSPKRYRNKKLSEKPDSNKKVSKTFKNAQTGKGQDNVKDITHSSLWNAMVYPLLNMTVYGALWYQGEANTNYNMDKYKCTLPALVADWRDKWFTGTFGQTNSSFPFGIVQLGPTSGPQEIVGYPDIRWHQTVDMGYLPNGLLRNTFMACAYDLTDAVGGVHFRDKETVSRRLALSGMAIAYGKTDQKYIGPLITQYTLDAPNHLLSLEYDHGMHAIVVHGIAGFEICCQKDTTTLCSMSGDDWLPSPIDSWTSTTVKLSVAECNADRPYLMGVRFEWRETPCPYMQAPVYSVENALPAPPYIIRQHLGQVTPVRNTAVKNMNKKKKVYGTTTSTWQTVRPAPKENRIKAPKYTVKMTADLRQHYGKRKKKKVPTATLR